MNQQPEDTVPTRPDPADSILLSMARAVIADASVGATPSWPQLDLSDPAQRQFGDYELLEEIGRGGMGVVYRARQRSLDRDVAIKFIADRFADPTGVARFLAEARAAARLLHPNIVPVHEVGSVQGMHYFSMPLIKGRSLASVLDAGLMSTADATALLLKLCEAIDYAHRLGLLHLDLKPANVLLDERGEPLIADFGLARHMDAKGGVDAQEVSGTPSFMAPEQILIKQYRLTPATDIYALGAILYRCLAGVSPHGDGNPDDVIRRAAAGRIRPPRELDPKIPRDLDAICMKCLELQPSERYVSVTVLTDDLRRARNGLPVSVRRIGFGERAQRWMRREPKFAAAAAFALLTLASGAAATTSQWQAAAAQRDVVVSERDRAVIANEIGAHLFAYTGDGDQRADDLLAWLRKRLPDNQARQADALTTFIKALDAQNADSAATLFSKIVDVLGVGYRQQMVRALQAGNDPHKELYIALLSYTDSANEHSKTFADALKAGLSAHPDDRLLWQVAAADCVSNDDGRRCLRPDATKELTRLDPDNMYAWLLLSMNATDRQQSRAALHEAARRTRFDDYLGAAVAAVSKAVVTANVPVPPLLARPAAIVAPNQPMTAVLAREESERLLMTAWQRLIYSCGASANSPAIPDPQVVADCRTVGVTMMRSNGALISRMIGLTVVKADAAGTPEAEEATQTRRLYVYLSDLDQKLRPSQRASYPAAQWIADISQAGEMAALQRRAEAFGFPAQPPADWKPKDLIVLQSTRERYESMLTLDRNGNALVAQGKYADALSLLTPAEADVRKHWSDSWLLARFLTAMGTAQTGLHDYPSAENKLTDAWRIAANFGPGSKDARDCARALVNLYSAWNAADPGKGHDAKLDQWQQTLATLEAGKNE